MLNYADPFKAICGDTCKPLIDIWNMIKYRPRFLIDSYTNLYNSYLKNGIDVYYETRNRYNHTKQPEDFFFLTRLSINGLIRFNSKGEFNAAGHATRNGMRAKGMERIIEQWHYKIQNYEFILSDYRSTTSTATAKDIIYFDPPYLRTKGMYQGTFNHTAFYEHLERLNDRNVKWLLSLDGTSEIPEKLYKHKYKLYAGVSPFRLLHKHATNNHDALYLNY